MGGGCIRKTRWDEAAGADGLLDMSAERLSRRSLLAGGLAALAPTVAQAQFANKPSKPSNP